MSKMELVNASEMDAIDHRTEVVIFHDMAEVEFDNSKALVWIGTQTFTIRHLDDEESAQHPPGESSPSIVQNVETIEIVDSPNLVPRKRKSNSLPQSRKRQKRSSTRSPVLVDEVIDLEDEISSNKINRLNNNVECIDLDDDDDDDDDDIEEIANASDNTILSSESSSGDSVKQTPRIWPNGRPGRRRMPLVRKPSDCETWCAVCGVSYGSEDKKLRHELTHYGINPERCPRCQKYFSQSSTYYSHKCSHNDLKKPQMDLPNFPFRKNSAKIMECSACRKSFPGIYKLKRHEISHTGEKPYKCLVCHRAFTQCTVMSRHNCPLKMIPEDKINPSCDICGKIFRNMRYLKIHKPIHKFEGRSDVDENDIENAFKDHHLEIEFITDASELLREMFG